MCNLKACKYDLPDIEIINSEDDYSFHVFIPDREYLVLGTSNKENISLNVDNVLNDNIPVMKRPSGGETVILTKNTLVVAISRKVVGLPSFKNLFKEFNGAILNSLKDLQFEKAEHRGISDLAINGKKILGSAMYKKRDRVLYHAVINFSESVDTIAHYISHPPKEPDYRGKRSHKEFVTSLVSEGFKYSLVELKNKMIENLTFEKLNFRLK